MFVISWQTLNAVDTSSPDAQTKIRAVAGQFQWTFDYLDQDGTKVLYTEFQPAGPSDGRRDERPGRPDRPAPAVRQPKDVIHAFYVPQFLFKRDVVPGRTTAFDFTVDAVGRRPDVPRPVRRAVRHGHSTMLFDVKALTAAEFDAWLADKVAKANATPAARRRAAAPASGGPSRSRAVKNVDVRADRDLTRQRPARRSRSTSRTRTPASRTTSRSTRARRPGTEVFKGEIFPGVATKTYDVPALDAGAYAFVCTVHPTMTGTLTVQ